MGGIGFWGFYSWLSVGKWGLIRTAGLLWAWPRGFISLFGFFLLSLHPEPCHMLIIDWKHWVQGNHSCFKFLQLDFVSQQWGSDLIAATSVTILLLLIPSFELKSFPLWLEFPLQEFIPTCPSCWPCWVFFYSYLTVFHKQRFSSVALCCLLQFMF